MMASVIILGIFSGYEAVVHYRVWDWANGVLYTIGAVLGVGIFLYGLAAGPSVQKRQTDRLADHVAGMPPPKAVVERSGLLGRWKIVRRRSGGETGSERVE